MEKVIKRIAMLFMVCGLAMSVSFGVDLYKNEEPYQKLKAEVEMWDDEGKCKLREDGTFNSYWGLCKAKNVLAFFDEIRAVENKQNHLGKAIAKVREMPRFKTDSGIYSFVKGGYMDWKTNEEVAVFNEEVFWKEVWREWEETKSNLEIDGARRNYWKKMAE